MVIVFGDYRVAMAQPSSLTLTDVARASKPKRTFHPLSVPGRGQPTQRYASAMRVIIMSDMEGVSGIVKWEQVTGGESLYEEGRQLYTGEINAAVRGAKAAGANEVVVMDCHGAGKGWTFNSLIPEALDPDCEWVVQTSWTEYVDLFEQGCDAALLVGMHSRAGTASGVLSHTVHGTNWHNLWFNGKLVGETGINAALCGNWKVPVAMVTGDDVTCEEGRDLLGRNLVTIAVKRGLGRFSARNIPPLRARAMIEAGAKRALSNYRAVKPYDPGRPCEIIVEYAHADGVEKFLKAPRKGVAVIDPRRICSKARTWWIAWKQFYF